jgi:REP element-mobilizing transposase RayT
LDKFVVMPNHLHGILWIQSPMPDDCETIVRTTEFVRALQTELPQEALGVRDPITLLEIVSKHALLQPRQMRTDPQRASLSAIIGAFKSATTREIHRLHSLRNPNSSNSGRSTWQSGFHEHIVTNELSLAHVRRYIETNPAQNKVMLSSTR